MRNNIVKVRGRQGTKSLDITLPVNLSEKYGISEGDLFKITVEKDDKNLKIVYNLIYQNK